MILTKIQILEALKKVSLSDDASSNIIVEKRVENIKINSSEIKFDVILNENDSIEKDELIRKCISSFDGKIYDEVKIIPSIISKTENAIASESGGQHKIKHIIAISSGKGGVGKSTIASNLAISFAQKGYSTGLLDADVHGPSIPKMFGVEGEKPMGENINGKDFVIPLTAHGVKLLSVGFFVDPKDATLWRGPMASNVFKQLLLDTVWGNLDYLFIDLPPGTSDIHLSMVQTIAVSGVIIVSTPQDVAIADVIKGANMFRMEDVNVPILGIIENMAWFIPAELPDNKYYIFGKDGCDKLAKDLNVPLLGKIPIVQGICESGDLGKPICVSENQLSANYFCEITENVEVQVEQRVKNSPPTKILKVK